VGGWRGAIPLGFLNGGFPSLLSLLLRQGVLIRILVTGATGFIGRNFVRQMLKDGVEVHAIVRPRDRMPKELEGAKLHFYKAHGQEILNAVEKARPEKVYHFASLFLAEHKFEQIADLIDSNLKFSTQLVEAMVENKCMNLVSAGTAWQNFNGKKGHAANLYAATKEAFEVILKYYADSSGFKSIVLKLNDTYGPADPRRKLLAILREAAVKKEALGMSPGDQKIDLLHISDVISAFKIAGARIVKNTPGCEEFYLRSGRLVDIKELVQIFNKSTGKTITARFGERPYRAREVMLPWQEGEVLPGWKPEVSLESGIHEYASEEI
jgi:nucleoside-diphosphate-sugar epimerase